MSHSLAQTSRTSGHDRNLVFQAKLFQDIHITFVKECLFFVPGVNSVDCGQGDCLPARFLFQREKPDFYESLGTKARAGL